MRSFQPISLPINQGMVLRHLGITWQFPGTKSSLVGGKNRGRADRTSGLRSFVGSDSLGGWRREGEINHLGPARWLVENMWVQHRLRLKQKGLWSKKSGTVVVSVCCCWAWFFLGRWFRKSMTSLHRTWQIRPGHMPSPEPRYSEILG